MPGFSDKKRKRSKKRLKKMAESGKIDLMYPCFHGFFGKMMEISEGERP